MLSHLLPHCFLTAMLWGKQAREALFLGIPPQRERGQLGWVPSTFFWFTFKDTCIFDFPLWPSIHSWSFIKHFLHARYHTLMTAVTGKELILTKEKIYSKIFPSVYKPYLINPDSFPLSLWFIPYCCFYPFLLIYTKLLRFSNKLPFHFLLDSPYCNLTSILTIQLKLL